MVMWMMMVSMVSIGRLHCVAQNLSRVSPQQRPAGEFQLILNLKNIQ